MRYMKSTNQEGAATGVLVIAVLGAFLMASLGFGLWAFVGREDYKKNSDAKVAQAVAVAEEVLSAKKEAEFAEREKSPLKTYTSPSAQGSVSFSFPKTWSALVTESSQANDAKPLDGYFAPNYLPSITSTTTSFALRLELVSQSYDQVIQPYNTQATSGTVKVTAFKPEKVSSILGVKIDGTISNNKQGIMVVLPLREKTLKIWTESTNFAADFNDTILPSLTFAP